MPFGRAALPQLHEILLSSRFDVYRPALPDWVWGPPTGLRLPDVGRHRAFLPRAEVGACGLLNSVSEDLPRSWWRHALKDSSRVNA